jgi:N-acetyl-1-D-myo-inositol-2-amino-2-deoxy-alpha-D-glucopyranoside deacetylase
MTSDAHPERRLLLVHAHPDDESINNGATMAKYVAEGAAVTLVTCTLGEEGEVLIPALEHLAAEHDDDLGQHRIGELSDAMSILGVKDWRFLGGEGHYRDTGMAEDDEGNAIPPAEVRPDSFWAADLLAAATLVVEVIRETRPQVMITYDDNGNYGHPDHIQAHRVAMYGSTLAAAPTFRPDLGAAWEIAKIYWPGMPESRFREGLRKMVEIGDTSFEGLDPDGPMPGFITPDDQLSARIDGHDYVDQKLKAMQAHATQITVDGPFFALSNNLGNAVWAEEFYRIAKGRPEPGPEGLETDLFAGVV